MDSCPTCFRSNFTSPSGRTLHIKACSGEHATETVALPPCPSCNKLDFTSRSGRTLHVKSCKSEPQPEMLVEEDGIYTLTIYDFVKAIDPQRYFITSGEAVAKAQKLEQDLWEAAGMARKLVKTLEEARGDSKFLESTWENNKLCMRRKDLRVKKNKEIDIDIDID